MNEFDENKGQWAIVELMGHKVVAGLASKTEMLGKPMLRVDVPATSAYSEFTQVYGESAIYCVTFVSEEVARLTAEQTKINPVSVYVPTLITVEQFRNRERFYLDQIARLEGPDDDRDSDQSDDGFDDFDDRRMDEEDE